MNAAQRFIAKRFLGLDLITDSAPLLDYIKRGVNSKVPVVTPQTAECINVLQACVNLICETKSLVKPKIVQYTDKGKEIKREHDQYKLLTRSANKNTSSISWEKNWVAAYLYGGNGYAHIVRDDKSRPVSYVNLDTYNVRSYFDDQGDKWHKVKGYNDDKPIRDDDMLHLADITHGKAYAQSRITLNNTALENVGIVDNYSRSMYEQGPVMSGYIYGDHALDSEAKATLRETFHNRISNKTGDTGILPHGFKYQKLDYNLPFADANIIEANKWGVEVMSRIYRVPLTLINRGESADNKGTAEWNLFLTTCIAPLCLLMQSELDRKIFRTNEPDHNVIYELKGLYRTSMKERYEAHRIAVYGGWMSPDEVRAVEGMGPALDGNGGQYMRQVNTIPANLWEDHFKSEKNGDA